ncbi:MAG: hypothetical protein HYX69_03250 [Planctomycetia bacterium]|nr:hypothetical protein [Planctomycetia bacterium]
MRTASVVCVTCVLVSAAVVKADIPLFSDDFNSGASPLWGNQVGNWAADGGVYNATEPSGAPPLRYSSLPFDITDFSFQVDMADIGDGGIWLRSQDDQNGVLLVTGGDGFWNNGGSPQAGRDLYWHVFVNGVGNPPGFLSRVANVFDPGVTDATIRVDVVGDTFKAYVNDVLVSTLVDGTYTHGRIALYDAYGPQSFDNVSLTEVPEGTTFAMFAVGLVLMSQPWRRRSGRRGP